MSRKISHYTQGKTECIDYIYDHLGDEGGLDYVLGNILKYATRAKHKGQLRSDLEKISHYAEMALERLPGEEAESESLTDYKKRLQDKGMDLGGCR